MNRKLKVLVAAACGAALMAGGVAYAAPKLVQAKAPAVVPFTNAPNVIVQTQYVPITPCRIIDTRGAVGGIMKANVARDFIVAGTTGFTNQGGKSGGCGIPAGATALAASISATGITGTGIIRAYPSGTAEPTATVMSYNKVAGSVTTGATLTVTPNTSMGLTVRAHSANTQFVADVLGYYIEPIAAVVNYDGTLATHSGQVTSSARSSGYAAGVYQVNFNQNITGCAVATNPLTTGNIIATGYINGSTSVLVVVRSASNGTLVDTGFNVTVTC